MVMVCRRYQGLGWRRVWDINLGVGIYALLRIQGLGLVGNGGNDSLGHPCISRSQA